MEFHDKPDAFYWFAVVQLWTLLTIDLKSLESWWMLVFENFIRTNTPWSEFRLKNLFHLKRISKQKSCSMFDRNNMLPCSSPFTKMQNTHFVKGLKLQQKLKFWFYSLLGLTWWDVPLDFQSFDPRVEKSWPNLMRLKNRLKFIDFSNFSCLFLLLKFFSRLAEAAAEKVFCLRSQATPQNNPW